MRNKPLHLKNNLLGVLSAVMLLVCLGAPASAQSTSDKPIQDSDTTRKDLAQFDQFLDSHREIAEQLRRDPSLVNNREFVDNHPALQTFLRDQPGVREELRENPSAFMRQENRFDHTEETRDRDATARDREQFDRFLDTHREISEQLHKDPSLVNKRDFVDSHPALQAFLRDQPGIREEIRENPSTFMRQGNDFGHNEYMRDRDTREDHMSSFGKFLGDHSSIAHEVSKDPSLARSQNYVKNHPELQEYLNAHPGVQHELAENPQSFVKATQQFNAGSGVSPGSGSPVRTPGSTTNSSAPTTTSQTPTHDPKPKP